MSQQASPSYPTVYLIVNNPGLSPRLISPMYHPWHSPSTSRGIYSTFQLITCRDHTNSSMYTYSVRNVIIGNSYHVSATGLEPTGRSCEGFVCVQDLLARGNVPSPNGPRRLVLFSEMTEARVESWRLDVADTRHYTCEFRTAPLGSLHTRGVWGREVLSSGSNLETPKQLGASNMQPPRPRSTIVLWMCLLIARTGWITTRYITRELQFETVAYSLVSVEVRANRRRCPFNFNNRAQKNEKFGRRGQCLRRSQSPFP